MAVNIVSRIFGSLRPLRLGRIPGPLRGVALANLVMIGVFCVLVVSRWRGPAWELSGDQGAFFPVLVVGALVAAGAAMTALGVAATQERSWRRAWLSALVLVSALIALGQLPVVAGRSVWFVAGMACTAAGLLVQMSARLWWQIVLLSLPYLFVGVLVACNRAPDPVSVISNRQLVDTAAVAAGALVVWSVASGLEGRHARVSQWLGSPRPRLQVAGALVVKAAVIVGLYAGLGADFVGGERLWRPRLTAPLSWLHAAIVAGAIFALVMFSEKRPLREDGRRVLTAVLIAISAMSALGWLIIVVSTIAWTGIRSPTDLTAPDSLGNWLVDHSTWLQLAAVAAFGAASAVSVVRRRRLTAGTALFLLATLWLVPPLTGILADETGHALPTFWATPVQVDTVLTVAVGLSLLFRMRVSTRVQLRLLLIPAALIYVGVLLPDSWDTTLWRFLLVIGVIWLLVARAPQVAADPWRHSRTLCALLGAQLATLAIYAIALTYPAMDDNMSSSTFLAYLWLAVPLAGLLTARRTTAPR